MSRKSEGRAPIWSRVLASSWLGIIVLGAGLAFAADQPPPEANYQNPVDVTKLFDEHCAVCHGKNLQGAAQGVALVGRVLKHGDAIEELVSSIGQGAPDKGMPAWSPVLNPVQVRSLAIYVAEQRAGLNAWEFKVTDPLAIPVGVVKSEQHDFRVEILADDLDPLPYTIAPLPDGSLLLTEKYGGLSHVSPEGSHSIISGTPKISTRDDGDFVFNNLDLSTGWMLGVAVHPDYTENGWVYLSYGDLCEDCERADPDRPVPTMVKLVRGRIRDGAWVDQQVIWFTAKKNYNQFTDMVSAGIIAFDDQGHVFLTIGHKSDDSDAQDLALPYGKILRLNDDGRIPEDNPFVNVSGALRSIWSYGHRNPQGLVFNTRTQELWSSEHGPRGGDEINLIRPGGNFGWPLYSLGVHYDGSQVDEGGRLGIEFALKDIEQPVVDLTPSPGVSALVIYQGNKFRRWQDNLIVGSLIARDVYRVVLVDNTFVHKETLLEDIGRVRDVKMSSEGYVYLLIEHASGGRILKLTPVP